MVIDFKILTEFGLISGFIGAGLVALPAFKSKWRNTPNYNPEKIDVNSIRSGLILISLGFLAQLIAVINQP